MKILCTGGTGFIGNHLVKALRNIGHKVEIFDVKNGQDILNYKQMKKAVEGKDLVYHLAAIADLNWARKHPKETWDINVHGTEHIARACNQFNVKMNYISTCCVYGNQPNKYHPETEEIPLNPSEFYACSKLAGEYAVLAYHKMYGMEYNILRIATIYGPGMRAALGTHIFISQCYKGGPITLHGTGEQTRTTTYVGDLIEGLVAVVQKDITNEIINISTEASISAIQTAQIVKSYIDPTIEILHIEQRPGQIFKEDISAGKAFKLLGWKANTFFTEGIEKTINAQTPNQFIKEHDEFFGKK